MPKQEEEKNKKSKQKKITKLELERLEPRIDNILRILNQ